jgi:hypothetical protein
MHRWYVMSYLQNSPTSLESQCRENQRQRPQRQLRPSLSEMLCLTSFWWWCRKYNGVFPKKCRLGGFLVNDQEEAKMVHLMCFIFLARTPFRWVQPTKDHDHLFLDWLKPSPALPPHWNKIISLWLAFVLISRCGGANCGDAGKNVEAA